MNMQGLYAVFRKELCDHFSSYRFVFLFALIAMVSIITSYMVGMNLKGNLEGLAKTKFPFLMLFSTPGALFSTVQFVAFFGPLIGLVLGFDTINRERADGTLIKIVSQPIYRDAVINGKFLAGVTTITIMLLSIVLVISGLGLSLGGFVPEFEEIWRLFVYLIISIFYVSFWLGVAILFSIFFKNIGADVIANTIAPVNIQRETEPEILIKNIRVKERVSLCSPMVLYSEATAIIIDPMRKTTRSIVLMGPIEELLASRFQNPLPLGQSLIVIFPHITALIAITLVCFAISYLVFMVQEIRT
jgi:ABC-2 type transport system permease protein